MAAAAVLRPGGGALVPALRLDNDARARPMPRQPSQLAHWRCSRFGQAVVPAPWLGLTVTATAPTPSSTAMAPAPGSATSADFVRSHGCILRSRCDVDNLENTQRCGVQQEAVILPNGSHIQNNHAGEDLESSFV